jgi:hypothetical protein
MIRLLLKLFKEAGGVVNEHNINGAMTGSPSPSKRRTVSGGSPSEMININNNYFDSIHSELNTGVAI